MITQRKRYKSISIEHDHLFKFVKYLLDQAHVQEKTAMQPRLDIQIRLKDDTIIDLNYDPNNILYKQFRDSLNEYTEEIVYLKLKFISKKLEVWFESTAYSHAKYPTEFSVGAVSRKALVGAFDEIIRILNPQPTRNYILRNTPLAPVAVFGFIFYFVLKISLPLSPKVRDYLFIFSFIESLAILTLCFYILRWLIEKYPATVILNKSKSIANGRIIDRDWAKWILPFLITLILELIL